MSWLAPIRKSRAAYFRKYNKLPKRRAYLAAKMREYRSRA